MNSGGERKDYKYRLYPLSSFLTESKLVRLIKYGILLVCNPSSCRKLIVLDLNSMLHDVLKLFPDAFISNSGLDLELSSYYYYFEQCCFFSFHYFPFLIPLAASFYI